jgi:nitroreductase
MDFWEVIEGRFSARSYTSREVPDEAIDKILAAIESAPSAGNLQSYKVVVVRDEGLRRKLADASSHQGWMARAPVFLVFFADLDQFMTRYGEAHIDTMPLQDATIAMAYAQLAAFNLGLGCCWIGTFARYDAQRICGLKGNLQFTGILTIGHTTESKPRRRRRKPREWSISL